MDNFNKVYHVIVCIVMVMIADLLMPLWASATITAAAAIVKELYDMQHRYKETVEWTNLAADAFGIIVAIGIIVTLSNS